MVFFKQGVRNFVGGTKAGTFGGQYRKRGSFSNGMRNGSDKLVNVDKKEDKINLYYCNSRSVGNKIDLLGLASVERPEVIAITET